MVFGCTVSFTHLQGADIKESVDGALRYLRGIQNPDGSYGVSNENELVTSLVLLAFGTSHRGYTEIDGPFVRKGVEWLLKRQTLDGSFRWEQGDSKSFSKTTLALAAIGAVNRFGRKESIEKGLAWLIEQELSKENRWVSLQGTADLFYLVLALRLSDSNALGEKGVPLGKMTSPPDSESIFNALWWAFREKDLPETFRSDQLVGGITGALQADPTKSIGLKEIPSLRDEPLWAGVYLLSLLHEKSKASPGWADRIVPLLIDNLEDLIRKSERENAKRVALLTHALSLCYGKVSKGRTMAEGEEEPISPFMVPPRTHREGVLAALEFLSAQQKGGRFGFAGFSDPGITALVLSAVIRSTRGLGIEEPAYVEEGLDYLRSLQKTDGSIYQHGLANYVTSTSVMAFVDSGRQEYQSVVDAARNFLIHLQADEEEGYSLEEDPNYGGLGYGGDERPDLSNTQMSLEALKVAGLDEEHEAFRKAILFLQRCHNYSEVNPTKVQISPTEKVISGNDGGGIYAPGTSKADLEEIDEGVFVARSYGSMTYALLKSYIFAGIDPKDKRVQAAVKWISKNYTLEENPGFKKIPGRDLSQQGLYYYYLTMAKALDALGMDTIESPDGRGIIWRSDLERKMLELQRVDGSWLNHRSPRWFEGNPVLATAYGLLVLDVCRN